MRAIVYEGPGKIAVKNVPKPKVGPKDILVKVKAAGICGSDLELVKGNRVDVTPPRIPGHELSGEVVEVGSQALKFMLSERVVIEPIISCGECRNCQVGRYNICRSLKFLGVHVDGAFAEYLSAPENRVYRIPEQLTFEAAAVLEPTAVGVHVVERAQVSTGDTVVVIGAGPIGLQVAQVAKTVGASCIIMTDVFEHRLKLARKLAADYVVDNVNGDVLQVVNEVTDGEGADVVIEAVGKSSTILRTIDLVKAGGRIHVAGLSVERFLTDPPTFWMKALLKEVTVETSRSYAAGNWRTAIKLVSKGLVNCEALVSHMFPLEDAARAFEVADSKLENAVKVLFKP